MRLIVATARLVGPGGAETYALTMAEQLARLGHEVTLHAREVGGLCAQAARDRALAVTDDLDRLPADADGALITVDRVLALDLASRYPDAVRIYVPHSTDDRYLPPPVPGAVAATVALSERQARRIAACVEKGELVRLRQPVDLRRFSPRARPRERPARVLLLGNYHSLRNGAGERLREAWSDFDLEWHEIGGDRASLAVPQSIAAADIVVGYGRSAIEGMACGRPVYVHDHSGTEGWVTRESYAALEAGGFAVSDERRGHDIADLRRDLEAYDSELGRVGHELARAHHDAREHAAQLVEVMRRLRPAPWPGHGSSLRAVTVLAEAVLRAETAAEQYRFEAKDWAEEHRRLQADYQRVNADYQRVNADYQRLEAVVRGLEHEPDAAAVSAGGLERRLQALRSIRYRMMKALSRLLDWLSRR
ncbi:MAG: hypothetical protein QOD66_819 [Solirubrobacteraceae bacterium]|nr:hypothetical protein [Solirubrobacteraceae bacterium]